MKFSLLEQTYINRIFLMLLFLVLFCFSSPSFALGENFLFLKNHAQQEKNISEMSLSNRNFLLFKTFEFKDSSLFELSQHNKIFLTTLLNTNTFSSVHIQNAQKSKKLSTLDIWEYLQHNTTYEERKIRLDEYLFLSNASFRQVQERKNFLKEYLSTLKKRISSQQNIVKKAEKEFNTAVNRNDQKNIDAIKQELIFKNVQLLDLETEYSEKKSEYSQLTPIVQNLEKKIRAIEENKEAILHNVKTQKNSGLYIGVVEE